MTIGHIIGYGVVFLFTWVRILHPIYQIVTGEEKE